MKQKYLSWGGIEKSFDFLKTGFSQAIERRGNLDRRGVRTQKERVTGQGELNEAKN